MALQQVHGGIVDGRDTLYMIREKDKVRIMALVGEIVVSGSQLHDIKRGGRM